MICRLCQKDKELSESHIIPKAFFMHLYSEQRDKPLIMIGENRFPKRRPIGSYEKLLCKDCEQKLGVYDNYAQSLLLGKYLDFFPNTDLAYFIPRFDYFKLKSFFISLLWRASITSLEEFKLIDVGPYETGLRELINSESVGEEDELPVFLSKFDSSDEKIKHIIEGGILLPAKQKMDGQNYSIFYLSGGYKIYIKVDKRSTIDIYRKFVLRDNKPIIILRLDNYEKSPEFKILMDTVISNKQSNHL